MIEATFAGRAFAGIIVITAIGLLWPLRYIWAYPLAIILLGIAAVSL
jgi:uncharacterized membrane protein